jgi:hypothetical protein
MNSVLGGNQENINTTLTNLTQPIRLDDASFDKKIEVALPNNTIITIK